MEDRLSVETLLQQGCDERSIAWTTGIPLSTVRNWRTGRNRTRLEVCHRCGEAPHNFSALPVGPYAYLLGAYLGDGHLARHRRDVWRLGICLQADHFAVQRACVQAMEACRPGQRAAIRSHAPANACTVNMYSKAWPCLLPQHGLGRKHERLIRLTPWQRSLVERRPDQLVRGLIHSDGCRLTNHVRKNGKVYAYGRYQFCNRSEDIKKIFCDALDQLDVPWRRMNAMNISVARREGVEMLDAFIERKR
jgi:hypothetical protein